MTGGVHVVGSLNADLVATVARIPRPGETLLGEDGGTGAGGKGANQSVGAARAGRRTFLAGAVGQDDHGELLLDRLRAAGVDVTGVHRVAGHPTGRALITVAEDGENTIVVVPGANGTVSPQMAEAATAVLTAEDVLLLQLEVPQTSVQHAAQQARSRGATVVLNAAPATALPAPLLDAVDVLVVNEHELQVLTGGSDGGHRERAARLATAHGTRVVVTLGAQGAIAADGQTVLEVPAPVVDVVDTTAAGDAFVGYLAAGLSAGQSVQEALPLAVTAGSLTVTSAGAQDSIPDGATVRAHHRTHPVLSPDA